VLNATKQINAVFVKKEHLEKVMNAVIALMGGSRKKEL
jgi:hypothetical protein